MNKRSRDLYCLIAKCAEEFIVSKAEISGKPDLTVRMFKLAEEVWSLYDKKTTQLDTAVPYYMRRFSIDCFHAYEKEETPAIATRVVQVIIWRTGLLLGLLAAHSDTLPTANVDHVIRLVCLLVPVESSSAPEPELLEKLILTAEGNRLRDLDDLAQRLLHQFTGEIGESLQEKSPVFYYGHPVDSNLVKMLDTPIINGAFRALVDFNADIAMGQLLASSISVTETNFPRLNRIVNECAAQLKIPRPYVVVTNQLFGLNAMTFGSDEEPYIAVTSLLEKIMSDIKMRFVIGHECGHIAMGHVIYHTAAKTMGQFSQVIPLIGPAVYRSISYPLNAWSRRSEITADRAGLLCCGDLEQAKRTLLQLESAFTPAETLNLEGYIANCDRFLEKGFLRKIGEYKANHPLIPKRIRALELFTKSEAYYRASGQKVPDAAISRQVLARQAEDIVKVI